MGINLPYFVIQNVQTDYCHSFSSVSSICSVSSNDQQITEVTFTLSPRFKRLTVMIAANKLSTDLKNTFQSIVNGWYVSVFLIYLRENKNFLVTIFSCWIEAQAEFFFSKKGPKSCDIIPFSKKYSQCIFDRFINFLFLVR